MTKLNQIIAVEKGVKSKAVQTFTQIHQVTQRAALFSGISRTYQPKDEEGEALPPESTRVQFTAQQAINVVAEALGRLFDVAATRDWANCAARADIVVDGNVLIPKVPVTHLLFLEKQLVDLRTFVEKLPVLDPAETWSLDAASAAWRTDPVQTVKTKKIPRNHVKAEATERHPAQVEIYYEDVPVGYWTTVKFSGALPQTRVIELLRRVDALSVAVKHAREEANATPVTDQHVGEVVFGYLFA
jgi:hypothetical protein